MRRLFFDCETHDLEHPRLVQLAWILCIDDLEVETTCAIVRPNAFVISPGAISVHGIDNEAAARGIDCGEVLDTFMRRLHSADEVVCHNVDFDCHVICRECRHLGHPWISPRLTTCTMEAGTPLCKLPGYYGDYKWPRIEELHMHLFGESFEGAHDALADVRACMRCYFEMQTLDAI